MMNVHSGAYYWSQTVKDPPFYLTLEEDIECDVLIIGGGISASQCAYKLADTGLNVVVV